MKAFWIASLFLSTIFSTSVYAANESASGKSLEGYETMDMGQFKNLSSAALQAGNKFQAHCTTKSGEVIASTDSRFTDCMNQSVMEMRQRKANGQKVQTMPGQQTQGVGFSTDL